MLQVETLYGDCIADSNNWSNMQGKALDLKKTLEIKNV